MLLNSESEITLERLEERINIRKSIRDILKELK
jgi:hypothetical protein